MSKDYKDILIKNYEEFRIEENTETKTLLRDKILEILENQNKLDSEDFYISGLTYYFSDDDKKYHLNLALEKFLESYRLNSKNFLACLYISHCYQDKGELKYALKYYKQVDKRELKEFQIWRYVKLIEQIGFCNYKLGYKELGRKKFSKVLKWYRKLPMEDRVVPTELLSCLPNSDEIVIEIKKMKNI